MVYQENGLLRTGSGEEIRKLHGDTKAGREANIKRCFKERDARNHTDLRGCWFSVRFFVPWMIVEMDS